jgi:hypothetical protein
VPDGLLRLRPLLREGIGHRFGVVRRRLARPPMVLALLRRPPAGVLAGRFGVEQHHSVPAPPRATRLAPTTAAGAATTIRTAPGPRPVVRSALAPPLREVAARSRRFEPLSRPAAGRPATGPQGPAGPPGPPGNPSAIPPVALVQTLVRRPPERAAIPPAAAADPAASAVTHAAERRPSTPNSPAPPDLEALTDQVVRRLERRAIAQRERLGRL